MLPTGLRRMPVTPFVLLVFAGLTGVVTYRMSLNANLSPATPAIQLEVDLERAMVLPTGNHTMKFPQRRVELALILPRNCARGRYQAGIARQANEPLLNKAAGAAGEDEILKVHMDFRTLPAGDYVLELRHEGSKPLLYPVKIVP